MELTPIKVAIGRTLRGGKMVNDYPNFNELPSGVRGQRDWSLFIDAHGGWHYDQLCGFGEVDDYCTDADTQYACALVPAAFAEAAEVRWPSRVTILNESEFASFYDNRAHARDATEQINAEVLNGLRAKYGVPSGPLVADETWSDADCNAIDPDHPSPGIVANARKTFAQYKARRGLVVCHNKGKRRASE